MTREKREGRKQGYSDPFLGRHTLGLKLGAMQQDDVGIRMFKKHVIKYVHDINRLFIVTQ